MIKLYAKKVIKKAISIRDRIYMEVANILLPLYYRNAKKEFGLNLNKNREKKIIVALTSFPQRFDKIHLCIEGLLRQTLKPDKVILYLCKSECQNKKIPDKLIALLDRGLTIEYVEDNLKPHKKYYYAMKEYKDDIIITVDDDAFYRRYLIERLYNAWIKYPKSIICTRAHKITFDKNKRINSYRKWDYESKEIFKPSKLLFATGVGGVLYPPHCMDEEVFNKENIINICLSADDVWLKAMQILRGTTVVLIPSAKTTFCIGIKGAEIVSLASENVTQNRNDIFIHNVFDKYHIDYTKINF